MERKESNFGMLDMVIQPAFAVRNGVVMHANDAAKAYFIEEGTPISKLLITGQSEYQELSEGCLYLTLSVADLPCGASVRKMDDFDLFTIEQEADQLELQAMALAAQELRIPLSNVMTVADRLFPLTNEDADPNVKEQTAKINRGLFQMLRIISNMSDVYRYSQQTESKAEVLNITALLEEVFEHSAELLRHSGTQIHFENLQQPIFGMADREKLERAVHNILSNAVKFSKLGSRVDARLSRKSDMLYLTVQDGGNGISGEIRGNVHARFRRSPCLEDSRFGIGLGMVLIRTAAAAHGGTVLIDHPEGCGTRITMSIAIRQNSDKMVRTSVMQVDYAGERNHALIEFSDVLPSSLYEVPEIN
jgi:signal transduction histidine kinase